MSGENIKSESNSSTSASVPSEISSSASPPACRLFVYGTLMSGFGNHGLLQGSVLVGRGRTKEKYAMFASGIPFVNKNISRTQILGELYHVLTKEALEKLDRLEGHPDWYERRPCSVELDDGSSVVAEIYFNNAVDDTGGGGGFDVVHIASGDFRDAKKYGNPGS